MIDSLEGTVIVEWTGMTNLMVSICIVVGRYRIGAAGLEEISSIMVQEVHKEIEVVTSMAGAEAFKLG